MSALRELQRARGREREKEREREREREREVELEGRKKWSEVRNEGIKAKLRKGVIK